MFAFSPKPTHLADFNQVQTIQYSNSEDKDRKGTLQLKIAGAPEVRAEFLRTARLPTFSCVGGVPSQVVTRTAGDSWQSQEQRCRDD